MKKFALAALAVSSLLLSACATTQAVKPNTSIASVADAPIRFHISGKIGITTQTDTGAQGGSAFYAWAQEGEHFNINLTGALGIGTTDISYDGKVATLNSERTGTISAANPDELLYSATGWQAPISQLPYWIVARPAPSDSAHTRDAQGRLATAINGAWTANFKYNSKNQPNRLHITHTDGHRVVMTINHQ
ncbi:lipoprotein insertase outer membrane protein LolB [Moraxella sp. FZFQ2102]|uniref:lipoprotein insertase outer membrane protein LolB n=1 Tax=Moraxella sp. FZFQ2102 TaxID=2953752 RepID=UPI00209C503F|nr:lipoprotein insertase outer membrane protein LolB [Moraxella sp. FZFQ2102]USZ14073.1 lipoprotein insertase outer membrane protein LolB [Moraxella sp. FZFQ2102]